MATKEQPSTDDCYTKALPHEEHFVILARDLAAPDTIEAWCTIRIATGKNRPDDAQIVEARECAKRMRRQYARIRVELAQAKPKAEA